MILGALAAAPQQAYGLLSGPAGGGHTATADLNEQGPTAYLSSSPSAAPLPYLSSSPSAAPLPYLSSPSAGPVPSAAASTGSSAGPAGAAGASGKGGHGSAAGPGRASGRRTSSESRSRSGASGRHAAPACSGTGAGGMLPANYATIVTFLAAHGYTAIGAAGIAGNIYQESKGNPESVGSGGGGLIGWTPLPSGYVTGNPQADLQTQLQALLTYNQQYAQDIPAVNNAGSASQAAYIYMTDFERPGLPEAGNREAAASAVAQACGL